MINVLHIIKIKLSEKEKETFCNILPAYYCIKWNCKGWTYLKNGILSKHKIANKADTRLANGVKTYPHINCPLCISKINKNIARRSMFLLCVDNTLKVSKAHFRRFLCSTNLNLLLSIFSRLRVKLVSTNNRCNAGGLLWYSKTIFDTICQNVSKVAVPIKFLLGTLNVL